MNNIGTQYRGHSTRGHWKRQKRRRALRSVRRQGSSSVHSGRRRPAARRILTGIAAAVIILVILFITGTLLWQNVPEIRELISVQGSECLLPLELIRSDIGMTDLFL